jgi:amidase
VRDAAALLDVLAGSLPGDPHPLPDPPRRFRDEVRADPGSLRICLVPQSLRGLESDPECVAAVEEVGRVLEDCGHVVADDAPRLPTAERMMQELTVQWSVAAASLTSTLGGLLGRPIELDELEPVNGGLVEHARSLTAIRLTESNAWLAAVSRSLGGWWAAHDLLVTSTWRTPPPRLGEVVRPTGDHLGDWSAQLTWFPMVGWWNHTGQPAISVPTGVSSEGLPIGVQLVAAYGREDQLLQVAGQLEQALPWRDRRPPPGLVVSS